MSAESQGKTTDGDENCDGTTVIECERDVTLFAYFNGDYEDDREFVDEVFGEFNDIDLFSEYEREDVTISLEMSADDPERDRKRTQSMTESIFGSSSKRAFKAMVEAGTIEDVRESLPEWLSLNVDVETEDVFDHKPREGLKPFVSKIKDRIEFNELPYEYDEDKYSFLRWYVPSADTQQEVKIRSYAINVEQNPVLLPQEERTDTIEYEADTDYWSVTINVTVNTSVPEHLGPVGEQVIPILTDRFQELDALEAVRFTECEEKAVKCGDCNGV